MKKLFILIQFFALFVFADPLQFAILGDAGLWNSNTAILKKSMMSHQAYNLIMPGDNLYKGTYQDAWNPWVADQFKFEITAIGNHNNGYANEIKFFNMPGEYYSKIYDAGTVEYLVLNSDNTRNVSSQLSWLETELRDSTSRQIFLVYHHPSLSIGGHVWTEKKDFQIGIRALLKKYRSKISAIIVGHDHIASLIHFDSLPVIVSGSTQNPDKSTPVNNVQEGITVKTNILFSAAPYWIKQSVLNDKSIFSFIRASDNKELCSVTIVTGTSALYSCQN